MSTGCTISGVAYHWSFVLQQQMMPDLSATVAPVIRLRETWNAWQLPKCIDCRLSHWFHFSNCNILTNRKYVAVRKVKSMRRSKVTKSKISPVQIALGKAVKYSWPMTISHSSNLLWQWESVWYFTWKHGMHSPRCTCTTYRVVQKVSHYRESSLNRIKNRQPG